MPGRQPQATSASTDGNWDEFFSVATAAIESIAESSVRARQRIEQVIPAAEARAADQRHAMIAGIGEELVRRTDAVDAECRRIFEILERVGRRAAPGRERGTEGISEGVRLLASQMETGGDSPQRIAERLESEFGVTAAAAVVAELLRGRSDAG